MTTDLPILRIAWPAPLREGYRVDLSRGEAAADPRLTREWLVTNGLGGYASGTVSGLITRRYHGVLVAALPAPLGRTVMLNHLSELIRAGDDVYELGAQERPDGTVETPAALHLAEFRLELGLPVWRYELGGCVLEKSLILSHRQNTARVQYQLLTAPRPVTLELMPWVHYRPHSGRVDTVMDGPYTLTALEDRYELAGSPHLPPLRLQLHGRKPLFVIGRRRLQNVHYRLEETRGYDARGELYTPGTFQTTLAAGDAATLTVSTEPWEIIQVLGPRDAFGAERERRRRLLVAGAGAARDAIAAQLVLAADQFLVTPAGRVEDAARARAVGDEARTVIAGYHWFTDWGRDTMIGLEGLTLATGRQVEAGYILRTFGHYVQDGLIPNMFPEGTNAGQYNTADATLWFFHALGRYLARTPDRELLLHLLPKLVGIAGAHVAGTRFGIGVDPADGLLRQGHEDAALTWMDARLGDQVITPRRGKPVEVNALWYNALELLAGWLREVDGETAARPFTEHAARARAAFNQRFWYEPGGHLFDVVDGPEGDDPALRPNQVLALALDHPVLAPERWAPVLATVQARLLTPVGLRSLAPDHRDYRPRYFGDLTARDNAYHQGTVWAWLIGPFVDAYLRVHPGDRAGARRLLEGFVPQLSEGGIGTISEIFDAEEPFTPRGCIAQAWSVAEVLRAWVKTAG
ncbi:MAG TPA: amylo-alpha-1,6-glucosidase [Polyangia bacterium]